MRVTMKKAGDSAAIQIPAAVMLAAKLPLNAVVDVREEAGRIVIEPVRSDEPDLATLIDAITPDNLHGELSLGPAMGRESL